MSLSGILKRITGYCSQKKSKPCPMNKTISLLIFIVFTLSVYAQEEISGAKSGLEIKIGFNTFGPAGKMFRLMVENDFDDTNISWFTGKTIEHPHYLNPSFNSQLSYSWNYKPGIKIGVILNYSFLREVGGLSSSAGFLFVSFSNISAVLPVLKFDLSKSWQFQTGPAVMINTGKTTSAGGPEEKYLKPSAGALAGFNLRIWDRRVTFGSLGISYLLATPNKMGPFTAVNWAGDISRGIPENRYYFGHMSVGFSLGFHLSKTTSI